MVDNRVSAECLKGKLLVTGRQWRLGVFSFGSFYSFLGFLFWPIFLLFPGKKTYFRYILDEFPVIFLRFSLVFPSPYMLDGFPVIPLSFSLVFHRETLFSLRFGRMSCHFP